MEFLLMYLLIINAAGFLLMRSDKRRAKKERWRIPESTLLSVAAIGGSVGALIGMYTFRHKTKHSRFTVGIPMILALQVVVLIAILMHI